MIFRKIRRLPDSKNSKPQDNPHSNRQKIAHPPPILLLDEIRINQRSQEQSPRHRQMENHQIMPTLLRRYHITHNSRHGSIRRRSRKPRQDTRSKELTVARRLAGPDVHHTEEQHGEEVDGAFTHDAHEGHPEDIAYAEEEDVEADELAGLGLGDVEVVDDCVCGDGEVAAVDVG